MNKNKPKKKVICISASLIILAILLAYTVAKSNKLQKIANTESTMKIGNKYELDASKAITNDPNPPKITAGMIPIKWDNDEQVWKITSKDDSEWYDYSSGKWANVMLSDGKYSSELERGKILAEANTPVKTEDLGTIFTWIPRLAYIEEKDNNNIQVDFLKDISVFEYKYKIENCFTERNTLKNGQGMEYTGIWVGQEEIDLYPFKDETEEDRIIRIQQTLEEKNALMNSEENTQGLIKTAKVGSLSDSDKKAVEMLKQKYSVEENKTMLQNISQMKYRQTLKVINENNMSPIKVKHNISSDIIYFTISSRYGIKAIVDEEGNIVENNQYMTNEDKIKYIFYIIDNEDNVKKHQLIYREEGKPELTGFNKNTTFYVTYDDAGAETSLVPIGETKPNGWYNYEEKKWANIVVRENGNTNYFVWIPRYMYKLEEGTEEKQGSVEAKLVDTDNCWKDDDENLIELSSDWVLPEAFTWNGEEIWGYWVGKYKLRENSSIAPKIAGMPGKISVSEIVTNSSYTYELYLIKDGKRVVKGEDGQLVEEKEKPYATITGNCTISGLEAGRYAVNIIVKSGGVQINAITKEVEVSASQKKMPNLTGFNKANTYYVLYNDAGQEIANIPIGEVLTEEQDEQWYNYTDKKWANIVVRDSGKENYFVWIPRYEYKKETVESGEGQQVDVKLIEETQATADDGYVIPEAFTWDGKPLEGYWIAKYKLRDDIENGVTATVSGAGDTITVSNILHKTQTVSNYEIQVVNSKGKIVQTQSIGASNAATGTNFIELESGDYVVNVIAKSSSGEIIGGYAQSLNIFQIPDPNLTGFNIDYTYIVTYNASGSESKQLLANVLADGYELKNGTRELKQGKIDKSKITIGEWYNYGAKKWANIKVEADGKTNYFVWIPRYKYSLDETNQKATTVLISTEETESGSGYIIPEAFTWNGQPISGYWIGKYKLRN